VFDNCKPAKKTHGYWALDLLGLVGEPVHATGYGIAHVGGRFDGCGHNDPQRKAGNWVWIDHGGGTTSRYYHLDSITISDGQAVTPSTKIGTLGRSGAYNCDSNKRRGAYLHYEERRGGGLYGDRVNPGSLLACVNGRAVSYPEALGANDWNKLEPYVYWPESDGVDCLPLPARTGSPNLVQPKRIKRGMPQRSITWTPPAVNPELVTGYVVTRQVWRIYDRKWATEEYFTADATATSLTWTDLHPKRKYQVRVAAYDRHGASEWSAPIVVGSSR
jgi:murein DD-endopeptidase MepM/ murein hydrolase activator NlpD